MSRSLLKLGLAAIAVAIILSVAASHGALTNFVQVRDGSLARLLLFGGVVGVGLGLVTERMGRAKCRRCGRPAMVGAALCRQHHDRLESEGRVAMARKMRDERGY